MAYAIVLPGRRGGFCLASEVRDSLEEIVLAPAAARKGARLIWVTQETLKKCYDDEEVKQYDLTAYAWSQPALSAPDAATAAS